MSKDIEISGIPFSLYTVFEKGSYYGKWTCMGDGETGESSKACGSEEEALKYAQNNAEHYLEFKYGQKVKEKLEKELNKEKKNDA